MLGKEYVPNLTVRLRPRHRELVRQEIPRPEDLHRRTLRHVRHDRRPTTLAIPSYVRVTNVQSGKAVVLRVNDRGPSMWTASSTSLHGRLQSDSVNGGSGLVEVERSSRAKRPPSRRPMQRRQHRPNGDEIEGTDPAAWGREEQASQSAAMAPGGEATIPKGLYVQLGAFGNADNAESLKNHLARELDWVAEPMRIVVGNNIHRLQVGPYPSRGEADRVAEKIRLALGYRRPSSPVRKRHRGDDDVAPPWYSRLEKLIMRAMAMPRPLGSKARSGSNSRYFVQSNPSP